MRLMIVAFVVAFLVIVDFAQFHGRYTHSLMDSAQYYLSKVLR
jgi:hypothetical protein